MRHTGRIGGAVLGAALAALVAAGPAAAEESGFTPFPPSAEPTTGDIPVIKGITSLQKGAQAPAFKVKDVDGKEYDFAVEGTRRAHLLVFWSIFCEPCREEMPLIEKVANEHRADGRLEVLAVNMDGEPFVDGIRGFMRQYKYTFRVLLDELNGEQFSVADPYQVAGTPVIYLVDAQGKIFWHKLGRVGDDELKQQLAAMLAAK